MTERQADSLLRADLLSRYALFRRFGKDALLLTVLSYNVGTGTLLGGRNRPKSRLIRKLERGDRNILPEYLSFCRYKGRVLPGLLKRRRVEFALFYIPWVKSEILQQNSLHPYEIPIEGVFVCYFSSCCFLPFAEWRLMVSLLLSFPPFFCSRKKGAGGGYAVRLYTAVYSFWMVIRLVFTSGCVENAQLISSSGKVLWMLLPITNLQFCRIFCRAFSLLLARTSNTPSKMYCVRTL